MYCHEKLRILTLYLLVYGLQPHPQPEGKARKTRSLILAFPGQENLH